MNLHELADRLNKATLRGDSLTACCPAHPDNNPSLSATIGNNGGIVLHCHAGCDIDAVLYALDLTPADLYEQPANGNGNGHRKANIVRTYPYTDAEGTLLFQVVRMDPKGFRQRRPDGSGGWEWNLKGVDSKPLYKLPDVIRAVENVEAIWLCEGEKDAERLQVAIHPQEVATTIPGGAGKWRDEHTETLRGAIVTIVADNDAPGLKHAEQVRAALTGVADLVDVVIPAAGKDAADHLAAGHDLADFIRVPAPEPHDDEEPPPHTDADYDRYADPWDLPPPSAYEAPDATESDDEDEDDEHTSWWPIDLAPLFDGTAEPLLPSIFERNDGQPLLYPGKAHAFNGEPESGKSWAALLACVQTINTGQNVLYIDFEDTAPTVVARLLALGADPAAVLERFTYMAPADPLWWQQKLTRAGIELAQVLEARGYRLAIIDGVTEAMVLHGLDINSNNDVANFYKILPRRLQRESIATVQIDHVPKSKEGRGRGGIGGQHKLAGIDVSFVFEAIAPFGIGRHGVSKISIEKDRLGQLRQHASGRRIADLHLESDPDTHALLAELRPAEGTPAAGDQWMPTHLMELVSDFIRDCNANGEHPSQRDIEAGVHGKGERIREAISNLVRLGYVGRGLDGRSKFQHTLITPYEEHPADEP